MTTHPTASRRRESILRGVVLLGVGFAMLALFVYIGRWLTFWYDEWSFILDRADPTVDTLLAPHVDHLSLIPVLIYQGLLRVSGLASYWPFLAVLWTCHFASVALLYRITARSAGPWIAVVAAISLLTLGCAFEDLLQAFQLSFLLSTSFGLLAIERLYRRSIVRRGDIVVAGVALAVAVASSSVGVIFMGVVLAWGVLDRNRDRLAASLPVLIVYGCWYLAWGRHGAGPIPGTSSDPLLPIWSFWLGLGAAVSGVIGLPPYIYAPLGLVIVLAAVARLGLAGYRLSAFGVAAVLGLVAEYALQAIFRSGLGIDASARSAYLYPAAILLWLGGADALSTRGPISLGRMVRVVVVVALALAVVGNLTQMIGSGRAMRGLRATMVAELEFLESVRGVPGLALDESPDVDLLPQVTPRRYLAAVDRFGPPGLAIARGPDGSMVDVNAARFNAAALQMLRGAFSRGANPAAAPPEGLTVDGGEGRDDGNGCITAAASGPLVVRWNVGPGDGFWVDKGLDAQATIRMGVEPRELAAAPPSVADRVIDGLVIIPPTLTDGTSWYAEIDAPGPLTVCRASTSKAG